MTKRLSWLTIVLFVVWFVAGCGEVEEPVVESTEDHDTEEILPEREPEEQEPTDEHPYSFPLTGLGTDEQVTTRPIVVMVENSPNARPQSGLDQADLVYEILAEGEITRFVAVYQSESPEVIGPVRSIRPYFVEIGADLDSLVVHAGWSSAAKKMLVARNVQHFDAVYGDHLYYWRSQERYAPHNLYTSVDKIAQGAEAKGYRVDEWDNPQLQFADNLDPLEGTSAQSVTIPYLLGYEVAFEYDEQSEHYGRIMAGEPHLDQETKQQLIADNILIVKTEHHVLDQVGRRDVNVHGPGEGYYVRDGQMIEVTWERIDGVVRIFADEQEVALKPGKTWIQFVPLHTEVTVQ